MKFLKVFGFAGLFMLAACSHFDAAAIECIRPPETISRNYHTQFEIATAKVLGLRGPSLSVAVTSEAKNLLDKIPNADKTIVDWNYFFTICTALRDDNAIPEGEKAKRISAYAHALKVEPTKVVLTPNVARSKIPALDPAAKKAEFDRSSVNINGNNAPVINNTNVGKDLNVNIQSK